MGQDIDHILEHWEYRPRTMQARLILASDGREVIQVRIDLGLLQLEKLGRPDGTRPGGFSTYREYLEQVVQDARTRAEDCTLNEEQCQEADREFLQFYHRRISWLTLHNYTRAIADADHTLALMDLVRDHSPSEEYRQAHEQYRGFVLFQRTQAAVALALEQHQAEQAIDEIHAGLERMRQFFADFELEEEMEEDGMVQHLRRLEDNIRSKHAVGPTLQEQLAEAIAREDYEAAARLRDELRQREPGPSHPGPGV